MRIPDTGVRIRQLDLCLSLRTSFLTYHVKDGERSLPERMQQCDFIDTLNLLGWEETILEDISLIKKLPKIENLGFSGLSKIKDFSPLLELPKLKRLNIHNTPFEQDIINKLPLLTELHFSDFNLELAVDCKNIASQVELTHLSLCCSTYYNEEALINIPRLRALKLRNNQIGENSKTLDFLRFFPALEELSIEMNMFSGFTPGNVLRQMAHLKKLHIKEYVADSQGTDWLTLDLLSAIPALEELRLENCYIEEENLRSKLTHLKHLEIIEN